MAEYQPFVLLDDAREEGASDAQLFEAPSAIFVAWRPEEVASVLEAADAAQRESGGTLAGYLAYEAGLALEPRLMQHAAERCGADGPLVWFGLFDKAQTIPAAEIPQWLAAKAGTGPASIGPLDPQISIGAYLEAFETLQEAIRAGDIYQANLTMPLAGAARGDPLAIYAAIRPAANAGYGGVIFDGSHWLLSFSPELFFSLKDGQARCKPMKGTRPRGRAEEEDRALAAELSSSVKDKAENLMIVDLMRNDLSRVARAGTVRVEQPFHVETYPTVHTMVTTVRAQLADEKGAMDMLRALFPCGSITGAPKIRAMELIQQVERDARGPYCGAIGRIGPNGDAAFNVAIRTIRLTPGENDRHRAVLGVGGAIVADSNGMEEWRECLVKGGFVRGEAGGHDLLETMRFDPAGGIPLLEMHLERIKQSAAELGFAFDRHETRNRIQALCFELEKPAKLRLLLARSGEVTLEAQSMPAAPDGPVRCVALPLPVVPGDWRLRHKSTDRSFYQAALDVAKANDAGEALFVRHDGLLTEGSFTSIFVEREGILLTPPATLGLLPGVFRRSLLEEGRAQEAKLTLEDLGDGFMLGNAVRGLMPAMLVSA
ncbi:para-aminobenzoate synthetase/4-amino-4-deoxychorismate lyase [Altererythrobacter atlanticus]|uniref:Aminodeoxychorismate synthase component 1 n=1 Tax=Croceibacterium atlanticum TaxID=1267766 RepID=A0A0F7KWF4_9SPHN|nr:aminodeoxychorismate synthase component I [Croceibacterium atlanticum]AKH43115.1 Aminodeoxychorismate synthase component 1 [Croceibacterium atlanticum]MBB5732181.1 para-aminobenzoate synthetase/4-amino-4-deoxychorismate lyase [Croceibacterium atlanticum]